MYITLQMRPCWCLVQWHFCSPRRACHLNSREAVALFHSYLSLGVDTQFPQINPDILTHFNTWDFQSLFCRKFAFCTLENIALPVRYSIAFPLCDFSPSDNQMLLMQPQHLFKHINGFYLNVMNKCSPCDQSQWCLRGVCTDFSPPCLALQV